MIARLWFVLSLLWAAVFAINPLTGERPGYTAVDAVLIFGPFALGLLLRYSYRYIRFGPGTRQRWQ